MLEIKLIAIFFACTTFLVISGVVIVNSTDYSESDPRVFILLPVGKNTSDIEFIVRECIYKAACEYPQPLILLCDFGADEDTVRIFEKLMQSSCNYFIMENSGSGESAKTDETN